MRHAYGVLLGSRCGRFRVPRLRVQELSLSVERVAGSEFE